MPPLTTARRTAVVSIALAVVLAVAALLWFAIPRNQHKTWVLRVDHSPPFYQFEENGPVTGLAVDVLNEAARRRGIRLIWTPLKDIPIDKALGDRVVQLWPLVGMTKERATKFYMSEPWLESDYILLSTRQAPIRTAAEAQYRDDPALPVGGHPGRVSGRSRCSAGGKPRAGCNPAHPTGGV
jgi:ABC-type amino acid transport substrate-binding protein